MLAGFLDDPSITEIWGRPVYIIASVGFHSSSRLNPGEHLHSSRSHRGQAGIRPARGVSVDRILSSFNIAKPDKLYYHMRMGKKEFLKQIQSLFDRKNEHEEKIKVEQRKTSPDQALIRYWQRELRAFDEAIMRAEKRLGRAK